MKTKGEKLDPPKSKGEKFRITVRICRTTKKVCYPSQRDAWKNGGKLLTEQPKGLKAKFFRAYKCRECKWYHLTSK